MTFAVAVGECVQIGIGAMPNAVCELLATASIEDLGVHTEIVCAAKDGLGLVLAAALTQEVRPLERRLAGIGAARVDGQEVDGTPIRVNGTFLVARHGQSGGERGR